jgi:hypothetical protein
MRMLVTAFVWLSVETPIALAQSSGADKPPRVLSMGQPRRWQPYVSGLGVFETKGGASAASVAVGVHRPILNPVLGLFGLTAEGYATAGGSFDGGGARFLAAVPMFGLGAGIDWNEPAGRGDFLISYQTAVRRAGIFGRGTTLRLDWLPTRDQTLGVGVRAPLLQPFAGRTRPRETAARFPQWRNAASNELPSATLSAAADSEFNTIGVAAARLRLYASLYSPRDERKFVTTRLSYDATMRAYLDALTRVFVIAAGDPKIGVTTARRARSEVLNSVLIPFDSLFGQVKIDVEFRGLTSIAHQRFERWLRDSSAIAPARRAAVLATNARWLRILESVHAEVVTQWKDSRLAWLPLQLALAPDEYDEQSEVDSLIERVVGRPFTDGNSISYHDSSDLPLEVARSIYAARNYHVLWTHDLTGQRESGAIDNIGYSVVADAYFPALTAAVRRYDETGRLPVYMILIDQFFYEPRNGRLWMTMLEDPLNATVSLPGQNPEREDHLRERQRELRAAVAGSSRLARDAARFGGDGWLRRMVKVHVNVVEPSDFSFRSVRIAPPLPFTPDNVMRDHRKIVFYDLDEADPYRGALLLMGIGLGEHYASATWEDRGYRLRGPVTLEARAAVRRTLRQNGFREEDIPEPLRAVKGAPADSTTERRANRNLFVGRALQVHNDVGFGRKESSIARAMLYTLALPGSVIVTPDPLWLSDSWAGMLIGAAMRGVHVTIIAPALANAPSPQSPLMALEHDMLLRVLELQRTLGGDIRRDGGDLRIGLFAARAPLNDPRGRAREVREGLARAPWIRELIPFDDEQLAVLDEASMQTADRGSNGNGLAHDEKLREPQLHQKTQLFAQPGAIAALVRQPGWADVLARGMRAQAEQTARFAEQLGWTTPDVETEATQRTDALLRNYEVSRSPAERRRVSFYFSLGTQNQDTRGIMIDGEASVIVSGYHAAAGLVDLFYLMARTTWITTPAELDQHLPPPAGLIRRFARAVRAIL